MTDSKRKTDKQILFLADEAASRAFAERLADACNASQAYETGLMLYLKGDLGAGKSFFSRAFIQHFLPGEKVKSPTYTLMETYNFYKFAIHHLDLYRLCDPEELEYLAIRDVLSNAYVALVEWPQKAQGVLPAADIEVRLSHLNSGRQAEVEAFSPLGNRVLAAFAGE
ncbi:tRNA (adenosine(37)-N6)-threonylcarbamoyltransferase complex ATPase subunit type 1 TsaE [Thiomicrorhabdus cannonii]|uniref:tRNA (adenosine(37)-N6)-threonylcarbamoyltransferase complex ATPase subunit type 1 TsaE n=1 Tax=Thiomicrorhabdus cannonii TaxID=2748011 RepID=UPI0015C005E9|nr:tRNA (adenosine(37)-N6)-threonylcarbamoyltransferase complex ATPase subunit type 1 TsaE [Thiomicrorhabdus cannonii]